MKTPHVVTTAVAALSACLLLATPAGAISIGFDPAAQSVGVGDAFAVAVVFTDLGGEVVSAYDLDVVYDPTVIQATDVAFTTQLGDALFFEALNGSDVSSPGVVDLAQLSFLSDAELFAIQGGDMVAVATLSFEAVGEGTADLAFRFDAFNDVKGREGEILDLEVAGATLMVEGRITSAPIPEPKGGLLFAMGAVLLVPALRRRPGRAA